MRSASGIKEVEYGEYPQTIAPENISCELERAYNNESLRITGKNYTTDSVRYQDYNTSFKARTHSEYEYNGERYIRFIADSNCDGEVLSDGRTVHLGNVYWVHVEPIVWLVDKERDVIVTKKLLFSGVQFNNKRNYKGDFDSTDMHYFLKNYFSKDIVPSKIEKPKLYIVNFSDEKEKYYPAYEVEDILREFYTNIELVPENANFYPDYALKYYSLKSITEKEYYQYIKRRIEEDTEEYLDYLFELCVLGKGENIYNLYEEEFIIKQINKRINEQQMKLTMK